MHHAIQQRIIRELIKGGAFPVLGFEFFAMDDTPLLLNFKDSARVKHTKKMAGAMEDRMRTKLGWENQSDTMWGYYYDLLKLGRDNGLFLSGLDLSASRKKRITRKGFKGLTDLEKKQIFSTRLGDKAYENHMKALFTSVHCGMGNEKMTSRLYDTWRARNDKMALSISQLHETNLPPIIVIMGKGHTEYGLGVMDRVKALNPDISQVNIALTEINREPTDLGTYLAPLKLEGHPTLLPADYLWFTQRVSYGDPCLEFKKSLEKMGPMAPRPPGQGKKAP